MLGWNTHRAGVELYMNLEGKAALKFEEVFMNANGMSNVTEMWDTLDHAFLLIDHRKSNYRQFSMRRWRFSERMPEYLDELIHIFRKARPGTYISFQDEEVKNRLLDGLDLSAAEIAGKYDVIHSQREGLVRATVVKVEKPLFAVQDKQTGGDDPHTYMSLSKSLLLEMVIVRIN